MPSTGRPRPDLRHDPSGFASAAGCMACQAYSQLTITVKIDMRTCGDRGSWAHWTGAVKPAVTVW
jgi:hypothetical protein